MKAQTMHWRPETGWLQVPPWVDDTNLVLYFAGTARLVGAQPFLGLRALFPKAELIGCSTGTQIIDASIEDEAVTAVALNFEQVRLRCVQDTLGQGQDTMVLARQLAGRLDPKGLEAVLVFADGLQVNGTHLAQGLAEVLGDRVVLLGALAAEGAHFSRTLVGLNQVPAVRQVVLVGLYGAALRLAHGASGGWDPYGPQRVITSSRGPVLMELDGKPALEVYQRQLGDQAGGLPAAALHFPVCIWHEDLHPEPQVRTILGIDPAQRSLSFAGDLPAGWTAQVMHASQERLVAGASAAAYSARQTLASDCQGDTLALLVSCNGRRRLMGNKAVDEVAAVADVLGPGLIKLGLYAHGGIAPRETGGRSVLHNQTMIVTLLGEGRA